jgi:hypothetical protein
MRLPAVTGAVIAACVVASTALAGTTPRYYTTHPKAALKLAEKRADRTAGFSDARCWFSDGNTRIGWRKANCTFNYNYAGTTYRGKLTDTLISCTKESVYAVIPGELHQRKTAPVHWKQDHLTCRRS